MVLCPSARGQSPTGTAEVPRAHALSALLRSPSAVRCAHKGPELGNAVRTQGRNQAVVCGVVLRNSVPCVRNRELHAKGGHPAPSGALRPASRPSRCPQVAVCQGAPSTIRCIKTAVGVGIRRPGARRQGAPSTIRCIKTRIPGMLDAVVFHVTGHPAPSGAFVPLPQKSRSWSSAQVPGWQRPTNTVVVPRADAASAFLRSLSAR